MKKPKATLREVANDWHRIKSRSLASSTAKVYRGDVDTLCALFGEGTAVASLVRATMKDALTGLAVRLTLHRIQNLKAVLHQIMEHAVDRGDIAVNPIGGMTLGRLRAKVSDHEVNPLSLREVRTVLAAAVPLGMRGILETAFFTGMRVSELLGLQVRDVCLDRGKRAITVRRAVVRGIEKEPKTKAGVRKLAPLLDPAVEALIAAIGYPDCDMNSKARVFKNPNTGRPWISDREYRLMWIKVLLAAGVTYRNPYQTRHTFASLALTAGEPEMWVASQMGHTDWGMIRKVYGKWLPTAAPTAGNKMAAMLEAR